MTYVYLTLAFLTNGAANVLLKVGASRGALPNSVPALMAQQWPTLVGVALFATNIMFYYLALRALPLSLAYPIMVGMSFLIASVAAIVFLREPYSWTLAVGYLAILAGIAIVVSHAR